MPSGGSTPVCQSKAEPKLTAFEKALSRDKLEDYFKKNSILYHPEDIEYVKTIFKEAQKHGLMLEWFMYFLGGVIFNGKMACDAANDAAIEWDF